jgi:hypothetical protein
MSNTIIHHRIPSVVLIWNTFSMWTFIFKYFQADIEEIMTSREEEIKACNPPLISTHLKGFSSLSDYDRYHIINCGVVDLDPH